MFCPYDKGRNLCTFRSITRKGLEIPMDFIIAFILFIFFMAGCLVLKLTMILPLAIGFLLFGGTAVRRGFDWKQILHFAGGSFRDSLIVVRILLLIGCLTGSWRISGTVAYFVTLGVRVIPPQIFLLAAFLLTTLMSFALGTSFGVTATAGVILISIARAGGISPLLAAGAIFSGVYVGDRGSPAASSGNLVAVLTHTDMRDNVKQMLKTSVIPFAACCVIYTLLSFFTPMQSIDTTILNQLDHEFRLNWLCLIPAILMILLPFCGLKIPISMLVSLLSSMAVTVLVQKQSIVVFLKTIVLGFIPQNDGLSAMLSGGGIASMLEVCIILMISGTYGGIFRGTGMLSGITDRLQSISRRVGRYPLMLAMSFLVSGLFCNQTIGIIMQNQLSDGLYGDSPGECRQKMLDIENSVVVVAGIVPWCIASSVPLAMLGVDSRAILFGFYLWLIPICYLFRKQ